MGEWTFGPVVSGEKVSGESQRKLVALMGRLKVRVSTGGG